VRILDPAQVILPSDIILRQIARVGARISDDFEALVKLLGNLQGALALKPRPFASRCKLSDRKEAAAPAWSACALQSQRRFAKAAALDFVRSRLIQSAPRARLSSSSLVKSSRNQPAAIGAGFDSKSAEHLINSCAA